MARYIDADELRRRVKEKTNPYGKPTLDYESGAKVLNMIDNATTADVVPKSEYEAVVSAVDNSTKEFLKLHDDYQEAKREADKWMRRCREWYKVAKLKSQLIVELEAELSKAKIKVARGDF